MISSSVIQSYLRRLSRINAIFAEHVLSTICLLGWVCQLFQFLLFPYPGWVGAAINTHLQNMFIFKYKLHTNTHHIHTHKHTNTCTDIQPHTYMHARTHARTHAHTHTHARTCVCTCMQAHYCNHHMHNTNTHTNNTTIYCTLHTQHMYTCTYSHAHTPPTHKTNTKQFTNTPDHTCVIYSPNLIFGHCVISMWHGDSRPTWGVGQPCVTTEAPIFKHVRRSKKNRFGLSLEQISHWFSFTCYANSITINRCCANFSKKSY